MTISPENPAERGDPLIGTMLGKNYRVIERIGSGGMAAVYLVEHQTLLKRFAAKVLSLELASSLEARARFTQEAHAASQLDHENIVSISDFGVTGDHRPFFVMELLRGQTLDQRLADGAMTIEEVVAVAVPVARALAHAHGEGIVHRDVKPENVFLVQRSQGRWGVKVVDFGIAKTPVNPKLTKMGETLGSPLFMAPEMIRGEDEAVDARTDVYSFGVLLYLMLCGRLPFFDENLLKVMQMHLSSPPPPPRKINPGMSVELAEIVDRALAKHPDDRYPSMAALLIDLEAALPTGSDRMLIEAQSGASLHDTPFAGALAAMSRTGPRPVARPHSPQSAVLPVAPRRSRAPLAIALGGLLALAAGGAVAWHQRAPRAAAPTAIASAGAPGPAPAAPGSAALAIDPTAPPVGVPIPRDQAPPVEHGPPPAAPAAAAPAAPGAPPAEPATASAPETAAPVAPAAIAGSAEPAPAAAQTGRPLPGRTALTAKRTVPARPVIRRLAGKGRAGEPAGAPPPQLGQVASAPAAAAAPVSEPAPAPTERAAEPPAPLPTPPTPATPPPSIALPPAPEAPRTPRSFEATAEVGAFDVQGSLSTSVARRSVDRALPGLRACYAAAARADKLTPLIDLRLSFEIDENSMATHVTTGEVGFGSFNRCANSVASQIHSTQAPDVGTARITTVIRLRPR